MQLGLKRVINADGSVEDLDVYPGSSRALIKCPFGLSVTCNLDWFGITDSRPHSTGAFYNSFDRLNRAVRYLPHNVHLATVIPGPHEPSLEQLNNVLMPWVQGMRRLYAGLMMQVYEHRLPQRVYAVAACSSCDLPASRKFFGKAGVMHDTQMCDICHVSKADLNRASGYDIEHFVLRDDFEQLKHAFKSQNARTKKDCRAILDAHGMRYSAVNILPGWLPISSSVIDFMHNFYGQVKDFWMEIIDGGYMMTAVMWRTYEETINSIHWPSGIGRLPINLATNHSLPKADQWRRMCTIQPFTLWIIWHNADDKIMCDAPAVPHNAKSRPTFMRSPRELYTLAIYLSLAEQILARRSITSESAQRGQSYLQMFCCGLLRLEVPMKPNHHFGMHYFDIIKRFGPVYSWWLFAFERFNGLLEDVNLNGHAEGEMELTLMRHWISRQRTYELVTSLPDDASDAERALVQRISNQILTPKTCKKLVNIRKLPHAEIYGLLLQYARTVWPDRNVVSDYLLGGPMTTALISTSCARIFPFIYKGGVRYGSSYDLRSSADKHAIVSIDGISLPCELIYHFALSIPAQEPVICSVIRRLLSDDGIPSFPWDLHSFDLGAFVVYANRTGDLEVVPTDTLTSAVAVIPIQSANLVNQPLWVVQAQDTVSSQLLQLI
ncbi:hypothetical protein FISHEDRAFT_42291 [Fistulina hepatica ATCC 64428]|uniref:Uncharacterized protein n=1 Tax=Fistulina hepatica ATCC 64428 TaxID=1128425 RepID=A0A0D7AD85_9AGAR|nr:hypothetical protein FISHEDRAFT_42291 [Fistulina hepatica ATCC 64428]